MNKWMNKYIFLFKFKKKTCLSTLLKHITSCVYMYVSVENEQSPGICFANWAYQTQELISMAGVKRH